MHLMRNLIGKSSPNRYLTQDLLEAGNRFQGFLEGGTWGRRSVTNLRNTRKTYMSRIPGCPQNHTHRVQASRPFPHNHPGPQSQGACLGLESIDFLKVRAFGTGYPKVVQSMAPIRIWRRIMAKSPDMLVNFLTLWILNSKMYVPPVNNSENQYPVV